MKQKNGNSKDGKGKKPLKSKLIAKKAMEGKKLQAPANPFDKFSNAKKKHEVLNRRVKGEDRNVGRARAKAIDERKSKLLKDYNTNKKSNSFTDKRFGESDANISLEEKMFMRFQQERVKKVRNSSLFNLDANDTEVLTHKGQALGAANVDDRDYFSSDEEGGGKLDKEVVNRLHFGGGMVQSNNNREEEENGPKRGRLEALQEIVMKSKLHKMQRKEAKEEQEDERDKLDKAYDDLFASSQIQVDKPVRGQKLRRGEEELDPLDAYDVSLREMAYETKVQPSDRTKTPEEIALLEQQKIEDLEKARLKRMRQVDAPEDEEKTEAKVSGVVASSTSKKAKHITDDQIDAPAHLTPRERKAAKNAKLAAKVAAEHGDDLVDEEYSDSEDDDDEEEEDEDEEESEEGSEDENDDDEDEQEEGDEDDEEADEDEDDVYESDEPLDYDEQPEDDNKKSKKRKSNGSDDDEDDSSSDKSDNDDEEEGGRRVNRRRPKKSEYVDDGVNINMPHKIKCPVDLDSFDELVDQYVRHDKDLFALVDRILAWNSVHLPGAQGAENKNLMHNFLDILLKHFIRVGDSLSNEQNDEVEVKQHLNYLCVTIFNLCQTLGESCVPLWGRTLKIMQSQLQKRLRDYSLGNRDSCWPSLGRLLLLQQLGQVFSVTDLKNEIVGPATLFLCQCLAQCPVATVKDIASGILSVNIVLDYTVETQRFVPEILSFVHTLVSQFLPNSTTSQDKQLFQTTFNANNLSWLRVQASEFPSSSVKLQWSTFSSKSQSDNKTASAVLNNSYTLIDAIRKRSEYANAFPELFEPILNTLRSLKPQVSPVLSEIQHSHVELLEKIIDKSVSSKNNRKPLQWRKAVTVSIDMKTPRFELDYTFKKDSDPDRERVQLKQLNRQLKREKKAAMRELRRDSAFIDSERYKEVTAAKEERRAERVKNFGWMEDQQATVNQQVRQGQGLMKGGGSSIAKKSRPKRL